MNFHDFGNAVITYTTAALAMFIEGMPTIVAILGFVLLLARLTYELPKAVNSVRGMFKKKE